uniref:NAD(P)-binding protein n=1 Tax=Mycena chlorophos TaxID=658473 RepID=A0ABQ0LYL9_MYCCL|nr:predicted protein [Mycena chlorophos]
MPTLETAKASNAKFTPSYVPVALFVGGTSGIGQAMAEAFARYVGGRAHIIIVGRSEIAAQETIARFPTPPMDSNATHEFIPCDLRLMANVRAVCADIKTKIDRVNFLVLTAGYTSLTNVALTEEGLDLNLAMRYYQRYVFISELLPLLRNAKSLGQDAHVMSVLGAGKGTPSRPLDLKNLGNIVLPRTGSSMSVAMRGLTMSSGYTDAMMAHFASQNPTIAFTHTFPGVVNTPGLGEAVELGWFLRPLSWILGAVLPWIAVSPSVSAEHMLFALLPSNEEVSPGGFFLRGATGDIVSSHRFETAAQLGDSEETSVLHGTLMPGYGASDRATKIVVEHSEVITRSRSGMETPGAA